MIYALFWRVKLRILLYISRMNKKSHECIHLCDFDFKTCIFSNPLDFWKMLWYNECTVSYL